MKKYFMMLLVLVLSVIITACGKTDDKDKVEVDEVTSPEVVEGNGEVNKGGKEDESFILIPLDEFVEKYNNLASLTDELRPLSEDLPTDENNAKVLLKEETYAILAIFNDDDDVTFYSTGLSREEPYEDLKGDGLYAALNMGASLELDVEEMVEEFKVALTKDSHTYFDNGHMIMMENHEKSGKSGLGMMIQVMKFFDEK